MSYFKYSFQKRLFCTAAAPSKNPRVFFSISSNGENLGKMTFEVYFKVYSLALFRSLP